MSYTVSKEFRFEACHRLWPRLMGKDHKCCRQHGHSYRVRVFCRRENGGLDPRAMVVDYQEIADAMNPLVEAFDHHDLNKVLGPKFHTTAENLAAHIYGHLHYHQLKTCVRVDVIETASTIATYEP